MGPGRTHGGADRRAGRKSAPGFGLVSARRKKIVASGRDGQAALAGGRNGTTHRAAKKKQRPFYSGKKKRHTFKTQLVVDASRRRIVCLAHGSGAEHDFALYKRSRVTVLATDKGLADSGYQGVDKLAPSVQTPRKKKKNQPLSDEDRASNRALARKRIVVENVIRTVKVFRVLSERYRGRRKGLNRRWNVIASLVNENLTQPLLLSREV